VFCSSVLAYVLEIAGRKAFLVSVIKAFFEKIDELLDTYTPEPVKNVYESIKEGIDESLEEYTPEPVKEVYEAIKYGVQNVVDEVETSLTKWHPSAGDRMLQRGDIIAVGRGLYRHYGIYINFGEVVHFQSEGVVKTTMRQFLEDEDTYWIIDLEVFNLYSPLDPYDLYSAEETVKRARELVGDTGYCLITNNCEHLAFWCKTGQKDCRQIIDAPTRPWMIPHSY
jgi:hypothetical protein